MYDPAKFFSENLRLFASNPQTQPEKFNLYSGLFALSERLERISQMLGAIEQQNDAILRELRSRS